MTADPRDAQKEQGTGDNKLSPRDVGEKLSGHEGLALTAPHAGDTPERAMGESAVNPSLALALAVADVADVAGSGASSPWPPLAFSPAEAVGKADENTQSGVPERSDAGAAVPSEAARPVDAGSVDAGSVDAGCSVDTGVAVPSDAGSVVFAAPTDWTPLPAAGGADGPPPPPVLPGGDTPAVPEAQADAGEGEKKAEEDEKPMGLLDHLGELRSRLFRGLLAVMLAFFVCYAFSKDLFYYLSLPLLKVMPADAKFIYTGVAEGFFVELKVGFVAAIFVACPYLFYQIWAFIAPGLYDNEKKYIIPLSFCSALFFITGAAFCYFGVFPFAFIFFLSYSSDSIVAMLSISEYLSFALKMMLAFGLIFEMPLFAFFLARMGLITAAKMRSTRKYAVLVVFIVAAILTPPDVFSQFMMAVPMLVLYEISIYVALVAGRDAKKKKSSPPEAEADPAAGAAPEAGPGEKA